MFGITIATGATRPRNEINAMATDDRAKNQGHQRGIVIFISLTV